MPVLNLVDKTCHKCKQPKSLEKFYKGKNGYRLNVCSSCKGRQERARLKLRVIEAFGSKCNCCPETHPSFLTLDHVLGSVGDHKNNQRTRKGKWLRSHQIWREVLKEGCPREKYQLLCMNCNFAKGLYGFCPHQLGITPEQALEALRQDAALLGHTNRDYTRSSVSWFKPGHEGFRAA